METGGWRGVACCEWPALPPGAMVRSPPALPLRAKSGSVAMQGQGSVSMSEACTTTGERGDIPGQDSHLGSHGCSGAVQNKLRPSPSLEAALVGMRDWALHLAQAHSGAGLGGESVDEPPWRA